MGKWISPSDFRRFCTVLRVTSYGEDVKEQPRLCLGPLFIMKRLEIQYYEKSGLINVTFEICLSLLTLSHLSPQTHWDIALVPSFNQRRNWSSKREGLAQESNSLRGRVWTQARLFLTLKVGLCAVLQVATSFTITCLIQFYFKPLF